MSQHRLKFNVIRGRWLIYGFIAICFLIGMMNQVLQVLR
jgi:hypothetical protein